MYNQDGFFFPLKEASPEGFPPERWDRTAGGEGGSGGTVVLEKGAGCCPWPTDAAQQKGQGG